MSISTSAITLFIDLFALLIIFISVLWGIKRGVKKSSWRLLMIFIAVFIAVLLTPQITNFIMNYRLISVDGRHVSINQFFETQLASKEIVEGVKLQEFKQTFLVVIALVKCLINLVVFILVFCSLKFLSWIIYLIVMREPKLSKEEKLQRKQLGTTEKKYRGLGALVGAVQGALLTLCFLLPLAGVSQAVCDLDRAAAKQNSQSVIEEVVPEEYHPYLHCYEKSIFNKSLGWINLDKALFNSLTQTRVNKVGISLERELENINKVYVDLNSKGYIDAIKNKTIDEKIMHLDEGEINAVLTSTFENTTNFALFKFALTDASNATANYFNIKQNIKVTDVDWKKESKQLSNSLTDITVAVKPLANKIITSEKKDLTIDDLNLISYTNLGRGLDEFKSLQLFSNLYSNMFTKLFDITGIYELGDSFGFNLRVIDFASVSLEKELSTFGDALKLSLEVKNSGKFDNLTSDQLSSILNQIQDSKFAAEFDSFIAKTIKEKFDVTMPEDFSITQNDQLIDSAIKVGQNFENTQKDEALSSEKSNSLLSTIESVPDDKSTQAIMDVFATKTGIEKENFPSIASTKSSASLLKAFLNSNDENLDANASALATSLENNPETIKILKFRNNTYCLSQAKFDAIDRATNTAANKAEILSLFTVV